MEAGSLDRPALNGGSFVCGVVSQLRQLRNMEVLNSGPALNACEANYASEAALLLYSMFVI